MNLTNMHLYVKLTNKYIVLVIRELKEIKDLKESIKIYIIHSIYLILIK